MTVDYYRHSTLYKHYASVAHKRYLADLRKVGQDLVINLLESQLWTVFQPGFSNRDTVSLWSDAMATIYFTAYFCAATIWGRLLFEGGYYLRAATIQGQCLFLWEACRHRQWLNKVCTSDIVTTVRRCQWFAQPLSPAVSCGNESYNMNDPSASPVMVVRKYSHVCCIY